MNLEEFYNTIGGDYHQTVSRLSNEALVKRFVKKYMEDSTFQELSSSLENEDWGSAFRAAHTLKGIASNLGFDGLFTVSSALTEELRGGKPLATPALWEGVKDAHQHLTEAISQLDD